MRKKTFETFELNCPYEESHVKCEVKECEECAVFTAFCRSDPKTRARCSKSSDEGFAAYPNLDDAQVLQTE